MTVQELKSAYVFAYHHEPDKSTDFVYVTIIWYFTNPILNPLYQRNLRYFLNSDLYWFAFSVFDKKAPFRIEWGYSLISF